MTLVSLIERSPLWPLGRLLIPGPIRAEACHRRGQHKPELTDLGRIKICPNCGAW